MVCYLPSVAYHTDRPSAMTRERNGHNTGQWFMIDGVAIFPILPWSVCGSAVFL